MNFAEQINISEPWLSSKEAKDLFTGQTRPENYTPLAMAYAGHQFGHLSPQLGDGRALLIGEYDAPNGKRYDVHLKGSGATRYARRGDGKATLRAALKEVIFSEYLAALNIPTSRSLAVYTTGETVHRQQPHPGAILVRMAKSLIRVGTFQYAALNGSPDDLRALADFLIAREYSELADEGDKKYTDLLEAVISRQAELIALWMSTGFIHGVMNTDNMALSGETIDFGPCAMMERFNANQVFSSIDHAGRYAWGRQAEMALWNLTRFAETLLPILDSDPEKAISQAKNKLQAFAPQFRHIFQSRMLEKIGLDSAAAPDGFITQLLTALSEADPDYTRFFQGLIQAIETEDQAPVLDLCETPDALSPWLDDWANLCSEQARNKQEALLKMRAGNPVYTPRLHLVEDALKAAENDNLTLFNQLLTVLQNPFEARKGFKSFHELTPIGGQTYCET